MVKEIESKTILINNKRPSMWFGVHYYLNIYRGCTHGCIYCDTRSECYRIDNFDDDISVKVNALELLRKELSRKRYKDTIGFGSTSDAYVPLELEYKLTRGALEIIKEFRHPLFMLTKSNLVLRDIDLIEEINNQNYACIAFTITTASDDLAKIIEPGAPLPSKRFDAMKILSALGIKVGVALMPMLPFITNNEENITNIVEKARECGASFIVPSFSVTLRDRQRHYFYSKLDKDMLLKYKTKYKDSYICTAQNYYKLKSHLMSLCHKYNISTSMPSYDKENGNIQLKLFD